MSKYVRKSEGADGLVQKNGKLASSRAVMLEFWQDSTSLDDMSSWLQSCLLCGLIGYWGAFHDSDPGKKPHFHVVLWFQTAKSSIQCAKWLIKHQCPCVFPVNPNGVHAFFFYDRIESAVRYLLHVGSQDKFQYSHFEECLCSDLDKVKPWLDTPLISGAGSGALASDFDSLALVSLAPFIVEHRCSSWHRLFSEAKCDPALIRCIRRHPSIVRCLVEEYKDDPAGVRLVWFSSSMEGGDSCD